MQSIHVSGRISSSTGSISMAANKSASACAEHTGEATVGQGADETKVRHRLAGVAFWCAGDCSMQGSGSECDRDEPPRIRISPSWKSSTPSAKFEQHFDRSELFST